MADLIDFLTARLAEDETAAVAAVHGDPDLYAWHLTERHCALGVETTWQHTDGYGVPITHDREGLSDSVYSREAGEHIARWDPARVLADVAAKRAILATLRQAIHYYEHVNRRAPAGEVTGLETAVKHLAIPYDDHPDYDPAWSLP